MRIVDQSFRYTQFTIGYRAAIMRSMSRVVPCVLMRAGTSRGPFFLREWLPKDDVGRDEALIGAIGASDLLQLDGVGGGSTLTSKVAIVSRSIRPDCDVDYLFAQVGVGQRSVDTRPNCGNMVSGVGPFAIEQGLVEAADGTTTVRVFNVNTGSQIHVTVFTPGRRVTYEGNTRIDGVAGTAAPIRLNFLDAWGAVTGNLFPTGRRIDTIEGMEASCIDAAMPLMIVRARDLGLTGRESPVELDSRTSLLERLELMRRAAGVMMGLGDVAQSVIPKPVLVSEGDGRDSITSRYFTPRRCHASHAVTGAIGVATAFALPGTVATGEIGLTGMRNISVLHPQGRIDVEVEVEGHGEQVRVKHAALLRTARKIFDGDLHLPDYVFSSVRAPARPPVPDRAAAATFPSKPITIVVPTPAGGGNDEIARTMASRLASRLGYPVQVDNRPGSNGAIASAYVARATPDGHTLMLGYIGTHAMSPALQELPYDPIDDFAPVGLVCTSPTLMVANVHVPVQGVRDLVAQLKARPDIYSYASVGSGTAPHFAAELFKLHAGVEMVGRPFNGAAPAVDATIAGLTQFMFPSLFTALPQIRAGRMRALAVAGPDRVPALPDLPTLAEEGIEGLDVTQWYALFAPARTPQSVIDDLNKALNQALASEATIQRIVAHGAEVRASTPDDLRELVRAELARWRQVVEEAGLAADRSRAGSACHDFDADTSVGAA
jgi:2-methylaconitate cis-trans-isomerase PrpF/tripartite-type tricarboxylate transporter receptor subunit TctC